jgi:hypothetical protein
MKPFKVYETDTDYSICVYAGALWAVVTTYDSFSGTHECKGTYGTIKEAMEAAKQLVKQYKF